MATPLAATARIVLPITNMGVETRPSVYVRNLQHVGSDWMINSRPFDNNDLDWEDCAQSLWDTVSRLQDDATAPPVAELQELVDGMWIIRATLATTGNNGGGTTRPGMASVLTLRDVEFLPVRIMFLDINQFDLVKFTSLGGASGVYATVGAEFTSSAITDPAPYDFVVGRGNHFLADSPWVSFITSTNRNLRRRHGLA